MSRRRRATAGGIACRRRVRIATIAAIALACATGTVHAEHRVNSLAQDPAPRVHYTIEEAPDSFGIVSGVTWHGDLAVGMAGRLALTERFAFDGQARWRDTSGDNAFIAGLGLAWTMTFGKIETTYDDGASPVRFDVIAGGGVVETEVAVVLAIMLRVRASAHISIDVGVRDEIFKPRGLGLRDDPELQVTISLTAANAHRVGHPQE